MPEVLDFSQQGELVQPLDFSGQGDLVVEQNPLAEGERPKLPLTDFLAKLSPEDKARQAELSKTESQNPLAAGWDAVNKPFTEYAPKLKPYVRGGLGFALGGGVASPESAVRGAVVANLPPEVPVSGAEGVQQGLEDQAEALLTPLGVATLGIGKLPKIAQGLISTSFALLALKNAPKSWAEFREALKTGDQGKAARAFINMGGNALMGIAAAKHGVEVAKGAIRPSEPAAAAEPAERPPIPPEVLAAGRVLPKAAGEAIADIMAPTRELPPEEPGAAAPEVEPKPTGPQPAGAAEAVKPEVTPDQELEAGINKAIAPQPKEANASSEQTTTKIHGDLRPSAGEGQGPVPVEEGEPGVQPPAEGEKGQVLLDKPWSKLAAVPALDFPKAIKDAGHTGQNLASYDLASQITTEDIPALKLELRKATAEARNVPLEQRGVANMKRLYFDEAIKMRQAMDEAIGKGAKTDAELARIARDNGVGLEGENAHVNLKTALEKAKARTAPQPDWRVIVSASNGEGDPGYIQIVDKPGGPEKPPSVESLRAAGHDVPDFSKLPEGKYTWAEAEKLLKEQAGEAAKPDQDSAARLIELKAIEKPTPEQIKERDALQSKSDSVKGQMAGEAAKLKAAAAKPPKIEPEQAAAKVEAQVEKTVEMGGNKSPAEIKDELVNELQKRLMKAGPAKDTKPGDTVTVDIPGDGKFTIPNSVEAISEVLERARKLKTGPEKTGVPRASIKSSARAIEATQGENERIRLAKEELAARESENQPSQPIGSGQPSAPPSPPGPTGMGGAVPSEFEPGGGRPSSNKNAAVDADRAQRGLPPMMTPLRRSWGQTWDQAMAQIDQDPSWQDRLISELNQKSRPITDVENVGLLHRRVDLSNELEKSMREAAQAYDDGRLDAAESARLRTAEWMDKLAELDRATKGAGTELGRGLNARKQMMNEDFSLARMTLEKRMANGGKPLTAAQEREVVADQKKVQATGQAMLDREADSDERQAIQAGDDAVDDLKKEVKREPKGKGTRPPPTPEDVAESLRARVTPDTPKSELGNIIQRLAKAFVRRGITERVPLVDAVHDIVRQIVPDMTWRETMDAISGYGDFKQLSKDQIAVQLRDLKGQMQQASKLLDLFKREPPSKTGFERRTPSDEERRMIQQVNEAKKRFGVESTDPAKQLKSALDGIKTRLRNQIVDLEDQIRSKTKNVDQRAPSPADAESKALKAKRDQLKAEFDEIFGKPGMTDEQRVQRALASVDRQTKEIERQLKEGDIFPGDKSRTPTTPELEAARAKRDALVSQREYLRESIQPQERLTPEERTLKALKTRLIRRTAELQQKLADGDFSTRTRKPAALDAEGFRLRALNERAKENFRRGLVQDRLKNRSTWEKAMDTLVKWRRAFLLSGPVTLGKLTSAAVQRMTITPVEEAIGAAYSKLLPKVAERAPREAGFNSSAEAKALTEGFTKGMRDAWQVLKTGRSDLDSVFGRDRGYPNELVNFMGNLHGALKTVTKRNEFARSFEKRMAAAIKSGVDVADPSVQMRIGKEAYEDANRSIFLQDNRVVSAYKRALSALDQPDKATGKPSIGARTVGTAARVLLPIVKIPTNLVAETMQYAVGSITGSARLANAFRKGIETLPPEHAELILRDLKKGSLGAAVMLLGFLSPNVVGGYYQPGQKRKPGDVKAGSVRVYGHDIPSFLLHNPLLETAQLGATIRRVADSRLRKHDRERQGITAGIMAGALGLVEEVPFVREMMETAKAFNPTERGAFFGELSKSIAIPQLVQSLANASDKDVKGNVIQRKPRTVFQHIEMGIPGLRQNVPRKPATP